MPGKGIEKVAACRDPDRDELAKPCIARRSYSCKEEDGFPQILLKNTLLDLGNFLIAAKRRHKKPGYPALSRYREFRQHLLSHVARTKLS